MAMRTPMPARSVSRTIPGPESALLGGPMESYWPSKTSENNHLLQPPRTARAQLLTGDPATADGRGRGYQLAPGGNSTGDIPDNARSTGWRSPEREPISASDNLPAKQLTEAISGSRGGVYRDAEAMHAE